MINPILPSDQKRQAAQYKTHFSFRSCPKRETVLKLQREKGAPKWYTVLRLPSAEARCSLAAAARSDRLDRRRPCRRGGYHPPSGAGDTGPETALRQGGSCPVLYNPIGSPARGAGMPQSGMPEGSSFFNETPPALPLCAKATSPFRGGPAPSPHVSS